MSRPKRQNKLPNTNPQPVKNTDVSADASGISALGIKSYLTAFIILILLMMAGYILTLVLPAGAYDRIMVDGVAEVVPGSYHSVTGGLEFWQWLLSPLLVLGGANNITLIMLAIFLLALGGSFYALEQCGVLSYLITSVARRFEHNNRVLLFLLPLLFMLLGSFIGSFEETVPLCAIVVALALKFGWNRYQGLGMSILATGCGFAVGVMNPYTVGIAQTIAELPLFSGWSLRVISFVIVYAYLMGFLLLNARKCEAAAALATDARGRNQSDLQEAQAALDVATKDPRLSRALRAFVIILISGIALIIACSIIPGLSDLAFLVTALTFLLAGLIATPLSGVTGRQLGRWFLAGMAAIAPAILLILMASSVGYTLAEGHILDTILYYVSSYLMDKPAVWAIWGIYLLVLVLELAIASGSAKAFLLMPLLVPLVDLLGIPRQLAVVAYAFGDGFSNVFYPTNPALLIALSISGLSFGQWFKRTWRFQLGLLLITAAILALALVVGYQ